MCVAGKCFSWYALTPSGLQRRRLLLSGGAAALVAPLALLAALDEAAAVSTRAFRDEEEAAPAEPRGRSRGDASSSITLSRTQIRANYGYF